MHYTYDEAQDIIKDKVNVDPLNFKQLTMLSLFARLVVIGDKNGEGKSFIDRAAKKFYEIHCKLPAATGIHHALFDKVLDTQYKY